MRVPWNDPVLIKPVLDLGAAGVIVPMVRTADDVRRAVAACLYPPEGIRGFGPRRPSHYGRTAVPNSAARPTRAVLPIVQIEHIEAVANIEQIVAVPGLASIAFGPNDLAGSMGLTGQPRHPDVLAAIDSVIARCRQAGVPVGTSVGDDPEILADWVARRRKLAVDGRRSLPHAPRGHPGVHVGPCQGNARSGNVMKITALKPFTPSTPTPFGAGIHTADGLGGLGENNTCVNTEL